MLAYLRSANHINGRDSVIPPIITTIVI